jgi:aminoglycoside phosphotransferase (APT) family kinase protein
MMGDDLATDIARALAPHLGPDVTLDDIRPLSSGASRRSWSFEASVGSGPARRYVLQREMTASPPERAGDTGDGEPASAPGAGGAAVPMATQAKLLEAAAAAGVPVAAVVATGRMHGLEYLVSEWLDGEALPSRLLRDPGLAAGRRQLMQDCARALVAIHRLPAAGTGLDERDSLAYYRTCLDIVAEPRPVLELAYRWLADTRPPPVDPVVVHGDFRLGNLLVDRTGLRAVLDWEIAHLGDRHQDVAWATIRAWRFDRHREPGVFPEPDPWVAAYNAEAGPDLALDPIRVRWWQVAGTWTWAVMSAMLARRHLDGWVQSVEHATIGRRVCESEWDVLELLP